MKRIFLTVGLSTAVIFGIQAQETPEKTEQKETQEQVIEARGNTSEEEETYESEDQTQRTSTEFTSDDMMKITTTEIPEEVMESFEYSDFSEGSITEVYEVTGTALPQILESRANLSLYAGEQVPETLYMLHVKTEDGLGILYIGDDGEEIAQELVNYPSNYKAKESNKVGAATGVEAEETVESAAYETEKAVEKTAAETEEAMEETSNEIEEAATETEETVESAAYETEEAAEETANEVEQTTEAAMEETEETAESAAYETEKAAEETAAETEEAMEETSNEIEEAATETEEAVESAAYETEEAAEETANEVEQTTEAAMEKTEESVESAAYETEEAVEETAAETEEAMEETEETTESAADEAKAETKNEAADEKEAVVVVSVIAKEKLDALTSEFEAKGLKKTSSSELPQEVTDSFESSDFSEGTIEQAYEIDGAVLPQILESRANLSIYAGEQLPETLYLLHVNHEKGLSVLYIGDDGEIIASEDM